MKKNMLVFIVCIMILSGCAGGVVSHSNKKPEDSIAEVMLDAIGDDYWYLGRAESPDGVWVNYEYLVRSGDESCIKSIAETISTFEFDENPYAFTFYQETSNGVYEQVFQFKNFVEASDDTIRYYEKTDCIYSCFRNSNISNSLWALHRL